MCIIWFAEYESKVDTYISPDYHIHCIIIIFIIEALRLMFRTWGRNSHLFHLSNNLRMLFMNNDAKFHCGDHTGLEFIPHEGYKY